MRNNAQSLKSSSFSSASVDPGTITRASLGAVAAVASGLLSQFKKDRSSAWSLLTSLSPRRILVSSPTSASSLQSCSGIFLSVSSASKDEADAALRYRAPEVSSQPNAPIPSTQALIDSAAVFTLGLILLDAVTSEAPFASDSAQTAHSRIEQGELPPLRYVSDSRIRSLLSRFLSLSPSERPSLSDARSLLLDTLSQLKRNVANGDQEDEEDEEDEEDDEEQDSDDYEDNEEQTEPSEPEEEPESESDYSEDA